MTEALIRIVVIAIGYCLALLSGLTTLVYAAPQTSLFTLPHFSTTLDLLERAFTIAGLILDAPVVTVAALGLVAVVIAEIGRVKSWTYHVLAWGAAGGAAAGASRWLWHSHAQASFGREVIVAFIASGFVAGFIYWLVAGRSV